MSVNKALDSVLANNLDEMRTHFSNALSTKAVEKLEERKSVIAQNYFGQVNEANSKEQLKAKYEKHHDDVASELENQALGKGKKMSDSRLKRKADAAGTAEWMLNKDGRKKHRYSKNHAKKFFTGKKG